jgi:hypothetical protein
MLVEQPRFPPGCDFCTAIEPLTHSHPQFIKSQVIKTPTSKQTSNIQCATAIERFVAFLFFTITTSRFHGLCFFSCRSCPSFFLLFCPRFSDGLFRNSLTLFFLDFTTEKHTHFRDNLKITKRYRTGKERNKYKTAKKKEFDKKNYLDIFYFLFYIASTPSIFSFSKLSLAFSLTADEFGTRKEEEEERS